MSSQIPDKLVEAAKEAMAPHLPSLGPDRAAFSPDVNSAAWAALEAVAPSLRHQGAEEERERLLEAVVQHVGEWALGLLTKDEVTTDDWAELRRLVEAVDLPDTDDPCACGHVRHEHHTWNENASVGCAHCGCEQFRLDLAALDTPAPSEDREPNEDEWCCDTCGKIAPEESEGWEQTPQDDAGVSVERCPDCRLRPAPSEPDASAYERRVGEAFAAADRVARSAPSEPEEGGK
jgi:hypothetical protein